MLNDQITETLSERDNNIEEILTLSEHSIFCPHCQSQIDLSGMVEKVSHTNSSNEHVRRAVKKYCKSETQTQQLSLTKINDIKNIIMDHYIDNRYGMNTLKFICKQEKYEELITYQLQGDLQYFELDKEGNHNIQIFQGKSQQKAVKKWIELPTKDSKTLRQQYASFIVNNDIKCNPQHYKIYYDVETYNSNGSMQFPEVNKLTTQISTICGKVYFFDGTDDQFIEDLDFCIGDLIQKGIGFERYGSQKEMTDFFINKLLEYQAKYPVLLIGYNSNSDLHRSNKDLEYTANKTPICGYDLPVIFDRSRHTFKFSIRKIKLSAEKEAITINRIYNTNIICLDLYPFIHKSYSQDPLFKQNTDQKLNTVLKTLGLPLKHDIDLQELFDAQLGKISAVNMLQYCRQDVNVLHEIIKKIGFNQTLVENMRNNFATIEQSIYNSAGFMINNQILRICNQNNLQMLPIIDPQFEDKKISGAFVRNPKQGIYNQLIAFDYSSLYPSIIISFNTYVDSLLHYELVNTVKLREIMTQQEIQTKTPKEFMDQYEFNQYNTFTKDGDQLIVYCSFVDINDMYIYYIYKAVFDLTRQSLVSKKIQFMKEQRNKCISIRDCSEKNSFQYKLADIQQKMIKVDMNTIYGVTNCPSIYRFGHQIVGAVITAIGRRQAYTIGKRLEQEGYGIVQYGDTDSIYLEPHRLDLQPEDYQKIANQYVQEYLQYGDQQVRGFTKLAIEEVCAPILLTNKKKNYIAIEHKQINDQIPIIKQPICHKTELMQMKITDCFDADIFNDYKHISESANLFIRGFQPSNQSIFAKQLIKLIQKIFFYFDDLTEFNSIITNKVKECIYEQYNSADSAEKRLQFLQKFSYKCSISGNSVFSKALSARIKQYQIPANNILKFEVVELNGDSISERLYPITIVHLDPVKFNKIDIDKLIYDQLKEFYRFTNPSKDQKVKYRKNKNIKNKVGVKVVSFNKKSNKSSHKTKRISIETFEDWFEEEIKSHEIGELIDDYNRPVKFYLDYEKEARFDNQMWGQSFNDSEGLQNIKETLQMHINSILKKYGVDLYINLVGAYSSRFLVDNRIKYSYHFVSKNFKSSHEFVRRIATDLHKILQNGGDKNPIDLAVYSKNQKQKSLRMFHSKKMNQTGELKYKLEPSMTLTDIFESTIYDYIGKVQYIAPPLILQREVIDFSWLNIQTEQCPLTSQITDKIKLALKSQTLQVVKESQFTRIKNHKDCPICLITHDQDQLYVSITLKKIYIYCFRMRDHGKSSSDSIQIPYTPDSNIIQEIGLNIDCEAPKLNDSRQINVAKLDPIICPINHVLAVKSPMGTGKTTNIISVNIKGSSTVIYITNRITLTQFIQSLFPNFLNYMDLDREIYIKDGMKIICQFESLYRLKFSSIDLIILDEFESMLNQINHDVKSTEIQHSIAAFNQLVLKSQRIVICDALLTNNAVQLIRALKPSAKCDIIDNNHQIGNAQLHLQHQKNHIKFILKLFESGKSVAIPITEQTQAESIQQLALNYYKPEEIVLFHGVNWVKCGDKNMKEIKEEALKNINQYLANCKVLIFTSSVSSGIDIQIQFDHIVGVFTNSCNIVSFVQMCGRVRNYSQIDVFVKNRSSGETQYENIDKLFEYSPHYIEDTIRSLSMQIYHFSKIRDTNLRKSPYFVTKLMLKSNGFNVIEISNNIIQQSDIKLSKIPKASDKLAKIMPNIFNLPTNIKDLDKCQNEVEAAQYYLSFYSTILDKSMLGLTENQYLFINDNIKYLALGKKLQTNNYDFDAINYELKCRIVNNEYIAKTQGKTLHEAKNLKLQDKIIFNQQLSQLHQILNNVEKQVIFDVILNQKISMAIFNKDFEKLSKSEEIKKTFFVKYYFGMFGKEIKIKQKQINKIKTKIGEIQQII